MEAGNTISLERDGSPKEVFPEKAEEKTRTIVTNITSDGNGNVRWTMKEERL